MEPAAEPGKRPHQPLAALLENKPPDQVRKLFFSAKQHPTLK
jgi:hypothetical protein